MNETGIIICVALCMFFEGELVEHTYKESMADCGIDIESPNKSPLNP